MKSSFSIAALLLVGACTQHTDDSTSATWGRGRDGQKQPQAADVVVRTDLVASMPNVALHQDPQLINAWGLAFGDSGAAWVNANGTGTSRVYDAEGNTLRSAVSIPGPASSQSCSSSPTGIAFNPDASLFKGDRFISVTEQGTIAGWQPSFGSRAMLRYDKSSFGHAYKGVALLSSCPGGARLYAANFAGSVDVYDSNYQLISIDRFQDPQLPAGFAPFNVRAIEGNIAVAFAKRNPQTGDDVAGVGLGYVDLFDADGNLLTRLISDGDLNAPWGMALSTQAFGGVAARTLFVGNFGDGMVHMYTLVGEGARTQAQPMGALMTQEGTPLVIDGLWALEFGNGTSFSSSVLYFTAGPNGEKDGVFGRLSFVEAQTPSTRR